MRVVLVALVFLTAGCEQASFSCTCYEQRNPAAIHSHDYAGKAAAWPSFAADCKATCAPFATQ